MRGSTLRNLSLVSLLVAPTACLDQNSKDLPTTTDTAADTASESGDATVTGTDTGNTTVDTDTATTDTDPTTTDTATTATDTDTDTGGGSAIGELLTQVLGLEPSDAAYDQIITSGVPVDTGNETVLGDCVSLGVAKPPTDIDYLYSTIVDDLPTPLPGGMALRGGPSGDPPLGAGPYFVTVASTMADLPLDEADRQFTIGVTTEVMDLPGWPNMGFDCDFYLGKADWIEVRGSTDGSALATAALFLTGVESGSAVPRMTTGRAFVWQNYAVTVVPTSELSGMPLNVKVSLHFHGPGGYADSACTDESQTQKL